MSELDPPSDSGFLAALTRGNDDTSPLPYVKASRDFITMAAEYSLAIPPASQAAAVTQRKRFQDAFTEIGQVEIHPIDDDTVCKPEPPHLQGLARRC